MEEVPEKVSFEELVLVSDVVSETTFVTVFEVVLVSDVVLSVESSVSGDSTTAKVEKWVMEKTKSSPSMQASSPSLANRPVFLMSTHPF